MSWKVPVDASHHPHEYTVINLAAKQRCIVGADSCRSAERLCGWQPNECSTYMSRYVSMSEGVNYESIKS